MKGVTEEEEEGRNVLLRNSRFESRALSSLTCYAPFQPAPPRPLCRRVSRWTLAIIHSSSALLKGTSAENHLGFPGTDLGEKKMREQGHLLFLQ